MTPTPKTHGGRRPGAGAKPTKLIIAELRKFNLSLATESEQLRAQVAILTTENRRMREDNATLDASLSRALGLLKEGLEEMKRADDEISQLRAALQAANSTVHAAPEVTAAMEAEWKARP
jgi:FtsZ-binding cell division protein ZapB